MHINIQHHYIQWGSNTSWANTVHAEKKIEFRNVVLGLQWFSWREAVCVFSGECAGQAETLWMECLSKAALFELWLKQTGLVKFWTEGHIEGCLCMCVVCGQVSVWMLWHVCVHSCLCTCLIWFTYRTPLCVPTKQYNQVPLLTSPWWWQLVYGSYGSVSSMFAWCFDAVLYLCVILSSCHSSFLLQASSVNAQLFTVSPAHHLASLIALDLSLAR